MGSTDVKPRMRLGIDLGGTKIEIVALDASGGERFRHRVPTPQGDYEATLDAIAGLVRETERSLGVERGACTIGIGTPGSMSAATGLLRDSNSVCLNGRPFKRDLESQLGREIRMSNDANCFAVSEAQDGAAAGARVVFGAILGTGVGAGIVIDGTALDGPNGIAGEWGHNPLPWPRDDERPGAACFCGRRGCIETFLSGPGFERDHLARTGRDVPTADIVAQAGSGRCAGARLARALRRSPRARARARDQSARPRRHRAGRRDVQHRAALRVRAEAVGRVDLFGPRGHAARAQCARRLERRARGGVAVAGART